MYHGLIGVVQTSHVLPYVGHLSLAMPNVNFSVVGIRIQLAELTVVNPLSTELEAPIHIM